MCRWRRGLGPSLSLSPCLHFSVDIPSVDNRSKEVKVKQTLGGRVSGGIISHSSYSFRCASASESSVQKMYGRCFDGISTMAGNRKTHRSISPARVPRQPGRSKRSCSSIQAKERWHPQCPLLACLGTIQPASVP